MASSAEAIGNPWATIWTKPRATIRRIVEVDVHYQVTLLAILSGALLWLERRWSQPTTAAAFPLIVVLAVVVGAIAGLLELYLNGMLLKWAGAALGGVASYAEVRAALAWSRVPVIVAVAIGILSILIGSGGPNIFDGGAGSSRGVLMLHGVLVIWGFILMLKCVGEVHRFSAWRALGALLIILLTMVALAAALVLLFGGLGRLLHPAILV